jgi:hypothetical protein
LKREFPAEPVERLLRGGEVLLHALAGLLDLPCSSLFVAQLITRNSPRCASAARSSAAAASSCLAKAI